MFWYASEILFAYFLTELAGLPAGQMGLILASSFMVGAVIDLAVGGSLQGRLMTPASAGRLQILGSILCSFALAAVFMGAWMPAGLRFAYAVATGIAFRIAFATYDIPQNALMTLATTAGASRLRIASTRIWFSGVASLIVASLVGPLVAIRSREAGASYLLATTSIFALAAIGTAWLLAHILRAPSAASPADHGSPRRGGISAIAFSLLVTTMFVTSAFTQVFPKLGPYFAAYSLRSAWWGGIVMILMTAGIFVGQPLWFRLSRHFPHGLVMIAAAAIQILALIVFGLAGTITPIAAMLGAVAFGLGNGGVGLIQWAAFTEVVASQPPRRIGMSYALFAATGKVGLAVGGVMLSNVVAGTDLAETGNPTLVRLMAVIPAAGAFLVALLALGLLARDRRIFCQS